MKTQLQQLNQKLSFKLIASSSKGNSWLILINGVYILIDAGVSYQLIKEYLPFVKYVLYTHKHGDHFKKSTYDAIRKNFPKIKFFSNEDVASIDENIIPLKSGKKLFFKNGLEITPIKVIHDVPCYAWLIGGSSRVLYATDMQNIAHINVKDIDLMICEANYDGGHVRKIWDILDDNTRFKFNQNTGRHHSFDEFKKAVLRIMPKFVIPAHMSDHTINQMEVIEWCNEYNKKQEVTYGTMEKNKLF